MSSSHNSTAKSSRRGNDPNLVVVKILTTTRNPEVWQFFDKCLMSDGSERARCKKCGLFMGVSGNTPLRKHANETCPAVKGGGVDSNQPNITPSGGIFVYDNEKLRESFCKFVIQEGLPFNHFDNPRLTRIIQEQMQPQYRSVSRITLRRDAINYWQIAQKDMQIGFQNLKTSVSLTCDVWSAPHSYKSYLCVTAHWLEPGSWLMNKRVVAFELFAYPHTGARLFAILVAVIHFYNLGDKIFSISFDNASNNTAAAKILIAKYKPILDGVFYQTRCVCHIINLSVQDGLKQISPTLEKVKYMLTRIFGKNKATTEKYRRFAISIDTIPYSPNWDIETRWNSTCMMFESLLKQRIAMQLFYDQISKGKHPVTDEDWDLMEEFVEMLKVFKQSTTFLSGVYYPTSCLLLNELCLMAQQLDRFEQKNEVFILITQPMRAKLVKYFKEMPPIFTCAAAVNPCYNVTGVEGLIKKISIALGLHKDKNYIQNQINSFNNYFASLFDIYAVKYGQTASIYSGFTDTTSGASSSGGRESYNVEMYNFILEEQNKKQRTITPSSELGIYMGSNFIKFMTLEQFQNCDVLAWWKEKEAQFPILSIMARDLLTVQASTVASESAFSFSGRVISKLRTNLSPLAVETCVCLKDYLDSVERIQHLSPLEGPLPNNVEPEILEQEYEEGISTPPEPALVIHDEDDEDEEGDGGNGEETPLQRRR